MKKRMKKVLSFLLAGVLAFGSIPGTAYAAAGTRPEDGTTMEQPFDAGTAGSNSFRIPCFVTLEDGTLVAGCDARWNTYADGGGLDTIISHSKDNGKTWNYTMANYLGDNGNTWNAGSTAFIDPALATDGKTLYLVADLYPAGVALNGANYAPKTGHTGYNADHQLVLAKSSGSTTAASDSALRAAAAFDYHLEKIEGAEDTADSYYRLIDKSGNAVEGYAIDAHFNIKGNGADTNLFCADSPYFVYPTDFLYMTKSEDAGATWSIPTLLDVKKASEQSLLVGPGRGIVTSTGRIVFTAYEFTNGDRQSVCIYSDDQGITWKRGADVTSQSSEAVVTEAEGRLYMFTRHGGYYVSNDFGTTWSPRKEMGITYDLGTQLSAITYSEKIDGKTAIIFSAPAGSARRTEGKLFTGLIQEDGTIDWNYSYNVNGKKDFYAYSCLDECLDGSIGLLYEYDGSKITYKNIPIEEIADGAAVGKYWLTDAEGNATRYAVMKSNQTLAFTVNGVTAEDQVTVESSEEALLTASYAAGVLTVQSKTVEGLKNATVTLHLNGKVLTLNAELTDSENYEKVYLAMGDSVTYTDETGNYADADLSGLDTTVAKVILEGEDYEAGKLKAQLATNVAVFDGDYVKPEECLYTFTAAGGANQYTVSAAAADGTVVYLSMNAGANVPNKTTPVANTVAYDAAKGEFTFFDGARYLYFWRDNLSKLHFDRNSTVDPNGKTHFALYEASAAASADSPVKGYVKVDAVKDGGKYLIAALANDGNYYVLRPAASGTNFEHVVKLIAPDDAELTAAAQLATAAGNFNSSIVDAKNCLYTFTAAEGENNYTVSAKAADGTDVYLAHRSGINVPNKTSGAVISAVYDDAKGGFTLQDTTTGNNNGSYLYFWRDNASKLHFDRNGSVDVNGRTHFELYKASAEAADSPIKGYVKVTEITEGGQYLIAAPAADGNYYVLYPSTGTNNFEHVAKVTEPEIPSTTGRTKITIEAVSEGKTSVTVGTTTYYITVKNEVKEVTLKVGETFVVPGVLMSAVEGQNVVSLTENTDQPPYVPTARKNLESGAKYLIAMGDYVVINKPSSKTNPSGLDMAKVELETELATDYMWTITEVNGGYTLQDKDGRYLSFNGSNVALSDTAQTLSVVDGPTDGIGVSYGGQYLNNYARENNRVAGYGANDCDWYFLSPVEGYIITAENAGKTDLVIGGVTYKVTVEADVPEETVYTAYVDGEAYVSGVYNTRVDLHADAENFVCWMAGADAEHMTAVSVNPDYTFYLANDVYLTAVYEEMTINPAASLINTIAMPAADGKINARFVAQLTVPEGAKVLDAGLVWSSKEEPKELTLDAEGVKITNIKAVNSAYQFSVTINGVPAGRSVRGTVFATVQLANGETTVYSVEGMITNN